MVIEWQRIRVRPGLRDLYLKKDAEVWTAGLSRESGFLGKEVWLGESDEVVLVLRWESEEAWKGMPKERLDELEGRFRTELPDGHEVIETRSFRVAGSVAG